MRTRPQNEEVLYSDNDLVRVTRADINTWAEQSRQTVRQRIRLCAHPAPTASVHEMLIVHAMNTYVRPHMHVGKPESFHVISGEADLVLLSAAGHVEDVLHLGPFDSGHVFYFRIEEKRFHTLLIRSEQFVFHETTAGPFQREATVFPSWAPPDVDSSAVTHFIDQLNTQLANRPVS